MKETITKSVKYIWGYDMKDKDFDDIEDLERFKNSYFTQLKFMKKRGIHLMLSERNLTKK